MNLPRMAVHRPVLTTMVMFIILILGGISLWRLPIDLMPDITFPTISISTSYENASPQEIEELVTRPVEEAMSAVPGVVEVSSNSVEGRSNVRVSFEWGVDLDAATSDVRDRLDRAMSRLPDDADRPVVRKFDLAAFPVLIMGAHSRLDPVQMRQIVEDQVKYRVERVPGVASLDIMGGQSREIHVNLQPDKVKALGLSLDQILSRIRNANINIPAGTIERGTSEITLRTPGEFNNLAELRGTVVAVRDGVPVRLDEVAEVEDSWQKVTQIIRVNGEPGIMLAVNKQSGTNTVTVATAVLKEVAQVNRDLPQIRLTSIVDTSDYIRRSINNVGKSAFYGGVMAIFVLLFFLRTVRSTLIIALSIPTSIIATFALLYFCGFTLNLMTLGGLALGVGMLVDSSIVVLENIYRLREEGVAPQEAALNGAGEVVDAVIASTLTTVVVFLPLIFMRGMAGVMFKQFSYVVGFALLCSLFSALTMVPMLASKVLTHDAAKPPAAGSLWHRFHTASGHVLDNLDMGYKHLLHLALEHRAWVIVGCVTLLAGSLALIPLVGSELMPAGDEGEVRVEAEMAVGTRLAVTNEKMLQVERIVSQEVSEALNTVSTAGGGGGMGGMSGGQSNGSMRIALKPISERARSSEQIADMLRRKLSNIPGLTVRTRAAQSMNFTRGMAGSDRVQVEVRGHDLDVSQELAERVRKLIEKVPGVTDARLSRQSGSPEELILVDRQKAADMRLTISDVAHALQTALSGSSAGNYRESGDEFRILVKLKDAERMDLEEVLDQTVVNADGQPVVLRNVVRIEPRSGPVRIERKDQERIVTISANITGRDMGSVLADARERLRELPVPRDFSVVFAGDYEEQQKAFKELLLSIVLALILVYMVMAAQYESLRDPFVVMFSVPMAAIGVVLTLLLTGTTFNIQSFIGCIMLGGIVVNNAILLVDHTNLLRRRDKMPMRAAIEEAGRRRLRPILMTALTTCLGLLPLAIGLGEGSEAQSPLARAVIGGLTSSALITLLFVPVVYSLLARKDAPAAEGGKS